MAFVYPVVHVLSIQQALTQAQLAKDLGAHGVFFISHRGEDDAVLDAALLMRKRHDEQTRDNRFKVGVNLLKTQPVDAVVKALDLDLDAVWLDNAGVSSHTITPTARSLARLSLDDPYLAIFSGVAFKYQEPEPDPVLAAKNALRLGFIPTTSGQGTGAAPDLQKIVDMSSATHGRLAVASGMTTQNVRQFCPHLSHILVATGVSLNEHEFDAAKLREFIDVVNESCA